MSASTPRSIAPRGIATHQSRVIFLYSIQQPCTIPFISQANTIQRQRSDQGFRLYEAIVKRKSRERLRRTTLAVVSQLPSLWEFFLSFPSFGFGVAKYIGL